MNETTGAETEGSGKKSFGRKLRSFAAWWALAAFAIGVLLSYVPWSEPDGVYGKGWPVYSMQYHKEGPFIIGRPNPYAILQNVALVAVAGFIVGLLIFAVAKVLKLRRRPAKSGTPDKT